MLWFVQCVITFITKAGKSFEWLRVKGDIEAAL